MFLTSFALLAAGARLPVWVTATVVAGAVSIPFGVAVGALAFADRARIRRRRRGPPVDEATVCAAIAAELHAGASLRMAVAAACRDQASPDLRRIGAAAATGHSMEDLAAWLTSALPRNGRHAAIALKLAADSGAAAAPVFDRLAARATRDAELVREVDAATAQARLSAYVVGGAPVAVVLLLAATGRLDVLSGGGGPGAAVALGGVGLVAAGLGVIWLILRAAR